MWGCSLQFWQHVLKVVLIVAASAGVISIAAGLLAGFLGHRVSELARAEADRRIASAKASEEEARADAARANASSTTLRERAQSLEQEATASRLEAEQLHAHLASRRITPAQEEALVSALRGAGDRIAEITVRAQGSDRETAQYASDIVAVLTGARLTVHRTTALIPDPPPGLSLGAPIDSADYELIKRAFDDAGISLEFAGIVPVLTLFVGPKAAILE